jgi:hypothetical protein
MARPERFELPTSWFVAMRSIQLSYGRVQRGTHICRGLAPTAANCPGFKGLPEGRPSNHPLRGAHPITSRPESSQRRATFFARRPGPELLSVRRSTPGPGRSPCRALNDVSPVTLASSSEKVPLQFDGAAQQRLSPRTTGFLGQCTTRDVAAAAPAGAARDRDRDERDPVAEHPSTRCGAVSSCENRSESRAQRCAPAPP